MIFAPRGGRVDLKADAVRVPVIEPRRQHARAGSDPEGAALEGTRLRAFGAQRRSAKCVVPLVAVPLTSVGPPAPGT